MPQKMVEMNEEDIKEAITFYLNNRVGQVIPSPPWGNQNPKEFWEMVRSGMLLYRDGTLGTLTGVRILVPVEEWKP